MDRSHHEDLARAGVPPDASVGGPFAETKELIAGHTVVQTKSREEAVEWARRMPSPDGRGVDGEIEARQLFELDDFGPSEAVERFRQLELATKVSP
jgi:hypothetical protein